MPGMLKRATFALLLVVIMSSCTVWKNPPKGWNGATGGEQLVHLFWDDIKAKNWSELDKHLAPTFVANSPDATRDRAAAIEHWKQYDLQSVNIADVQVQTAGADFIVTATVTATGTVGGKPLTGQPIHTMSVWQQVSKGWTMVAHADALP
jgi:Domain of unknown function (DUF4440)